MALLDRSALERSPVVANCAMNRERRLTGSNGCGRELGLDVLAFLRSSSRSAAWADLCCGSGRALVEAAAALAREGGAVQVSIEGVDPSRSR